MSDRKIKVTIPQIGAPKIEAIGFNGDGCTEATYSIEKALSGSGGVSREFKPEWAENGDQTEQQHLHW